MRPFNLRLEWKKMGFNAYVPLIAVMLGLSVIAGTKGDFNVFMPLMELMLPLLSGWWILFLLHDTLSEEGNELLFSLPVPRWKLGLLPVVCFYLLYVLVLVFMLICSIPWIELDSLFWLAVQFVSQSFFFSALAFLAMVWTRSTGWSFILLVVYVSFALLTARSPFLLDIYLHHTGPIPLQEVGGFLKKTWIFGLIFMVNAQFFLSTTTRYKI